MSLPFGGRWKRYRVLDALRFGSDGGVPLKPPNPYPSLRVILAEKGIPIIRGLAEKGTHY